MSLRSFASIPTASTVFALGARYPTKTQPGFSATTTRHVWLTTGGALSFQAQGQAWFQSSDGPLYVVSGASTYMASDSAGALLGGASAVGIMAGYCGPVLEEEVGGEDADPGTPSAIGDIEAGFGTAGLVWAAVHRGTNLALLGRAVHRFVTIVTKKDYAQWVLPFLAMAANTAGHVVWAVGKATGAPSKALSIFSQAGILSGTPAFCSLYGGLSAAARSANVTLFGLIGCDVKSLAVARMDSMGSASISGGVEVQAESGKTMAVAATKKGLTLQGAEVSLGGMVQDGAQLPTKSIAIDAASEIALRTDQPGQGITHEAQSTLKIDAPLGAELSQLGTKIEVAGKWTISATTDGNIQIEGAGGTVLLLSPSSIVVGPASGAQVRLDATQVDVGQGSLSMTPASGAMKVGRVEIL